MKRSKSPSPMSTNTLTKPRILSSSKKIKPESPQKIKQELRFAPEAIYVSDDNFGGAGITETLDVYANPDAVYAEGHQEEYHLEENSSNINFKVYGAAIAFLEY